MGESSAGCTMLRTSLPVLVASLACLSPAKGAPASQCCAEKSVGGIVYSLYQETGDTEQYNCLDSCIYQDKANPGPQFCFQTGNLPVECLQDQPDTATQAQGCKCGVKNKPRIVGGTETEVNEFPWMAALKKYDSFFCGGTLVASKWVLSAAHCLFSDLELTMEVPASEIEIVLGDHDHTVDDESDITKTIQLESYIMHPDFNMDGDLNADIAMLKLAEEVDLNIFTPACLANMGDTFVGKKAWAYGWGGLDPAATEYPNKLMKVELEIVSDEICQSDMEANGWVTTITPGMLCAGGIGGEDSCGGDSGGPLTVDVDGQHVLVGDTSFGHQDGCAQEGFYGIYAEIAVYRDWVDSTMAAEGQPITCPA